MPKILIADDNTNIQRMVALAFEERGIQVVSVGNGEAAVRRLADLNPDLVLADIFMPVRSGYEVCEYIKKDKNFCHIPVILLVGAFDPLDEKEARRVGADGVLKKPFVPPDPLIAMVTSALEKNPRVAAELAKSREVIVEPPPPPVPEIAARIEPKPLPEFPEPTPEETALLYGFGSRRHSILDEEKDRESVAPIDVGAEEEFDEDAATAGDWRRAAMDFEVPQEDGGRPAFSDDAAFPSVHEIPVPPAPLSESSADPEPVTAEKAADKFDFASLASDALSASVTVAPSTPLSFVPSEDIPVAADPERETPAAESSVQSHPDATPGVTSDATQHVPHWMDALSAVPPDSGWMAGLSRKQEEVKESEEVHEPLAALDLPGTVAGTPDFKTDVQEMAAAPVSQPSSGMDSSFVIEPAGEPEGESWFAPAPAAFVSSREPAPLEHAHAELAENVPLSLALPLISVPDPVSVDAQAHLGASRREPELDEPTAVRVTPEPLLDSEESDIPAPVSRRELDLIAPSAVRVTPEPLLDSEESLPAAHMYSRIEEVAPAYSLIAPPPASQSAEEETEEPLELHPEHEAAIVESCVEEFSERIPTGPPPSREALAEIPFLTPPEDFRSPANYAAPVDHAPEEPGINAETVDAVVRKVLERLEPQLHDLLSQGVLKPLIENMLHGELAKKNR